MGTDQIQPAVRAVSAQDRAGSGQDRAGSGQVHPAPVAECVRVAIQGEHGSNSHMAALALFPTAKIVPCSQAAEVFEQVQAGGADVAVLPIENSLHGSVFEHYDLLHEHRLHIAGESSLRIRHNVIAAPGVALSDIRTIQSHPVALSQCRQWLRAHPHLQVVPAYDTAGSVKRLMEGRLRDVAGIAPALAAQAYGAEVLVPEIQDHAENWTRFYTLVREPRDDPHADKISVAFTLPHRPGTLLQALEVFASLSMDLTRIESRPVPGKPWEYVFFADVRFAARAQADQALARLRALCEHTVVFGLYRAAGN